MQDDKIIGLFFDRSESAISETQKKYGRYCRYIAYQILGSREDADECVNDAYLSLWNSIPPERPHDLRHFLGCVVRRLSLNRVDYLGAQKRRCETLLSLDEYAECIPDNSASLGDTSALREAINGFLSSLGRRTRVVFMQRYWYHLSVAQIARENGMTESNVKVTLHRTRESFKKYLEERSLYE